MNIYLVGFMGTGKTSVGKELAKKKKWQFVDLDELIEFKEKRAISDIFAQEGEGYFRRAEAKVLKEVAGQKGFVVACGGGVVINEDNIRLMKRTGRIICLRARPQVILKRTRGYAHRPLLNVPNPGKQVELLLKLRSPYYARADKQLDTSRLSIAQAAARIAGLFRQSGAGKKTASAAGRKRKK
jgi:shikimate kinase